MNHIIELVREWRDLISEISPRVEHYGVKALCQNVDAFVLIFCAIKSNFKSSLPTPPHFTIETDVLFCAFFLNLMKHFESPINIRDRKTQLFGSDQAFPLV
jgi:hypothetical protein